MNNEDIRCTGSSAEIPCQASGDAERVVGEDLDFPLPGAERRRVDMSHIKLFMLGHAHIDLGYRWDYAETVHRIAPWTFKGVLNLMDRIKGVTFCQSQAFLYQAMEREYPELFLRIRERIRVGQWEFIGCAWCEYDAMLTGGESIIRQHLQALRYAEEKLGVKDHRVAFFPDSFCGHAATLPQILSGCGFRYYLLGRGLPHDPDRPDAPRRVFTWQGRDGSSLTAFFTFGPYSTPLLDEKQLAKLLPYIKSGVDNRELVLYGIGDHGGGPREEDINALRALSSVPQAPQWHFATAAQYFDSVFAGPGAPELRAFQGNLPKGLSGALTSQAGVKRQNRLLERLMCAAESLAVIGSLLQRKPAYPRVDFQQLWREFLTHQFHDVLPGTSVASVYRDVNLSYNRIRCCLENLARDAMDRLAARLDTRGEGYALLVCNPSLSEAHAVVEAPLPAFLRNTPPFPLLLDSNGSEVEAVVVEGGLRFKAAIPPLGYELFRLRPDVSGSGRAFAPCVENASLETDRYTLKFDSLTGDILSISARNGEGQLLRGPSNILLLFDEDEQATSWVEVLRGRRQDVRLVQPPSVVEHTPFFTRIRTVSKTAWSTFTREITVYRDIGRLDFRLSVDWFESNSFLKIGIAPAVENAGVTASVPFGSVAVENPLNEFAIREWVLLRSPSSAVAVFNDGCHGADFKNGVLGLSVVRNARDMDPAMDHGRHELKYALLPLPADATESDLVREQESFLAAFLLKWESHHPGPISKWGGVGMLPALPARGCFLKAEPGNVAVCAFKMPEEDWTPQSFVVRVRETDGLATDAIVTMPVPISSAASADHLERRGNQILDASGDKVKLRLKPYEIATFVAR